MSVKEDTLHSLAVSILQLSIEPAIDRQRKIDVPCNQLLSPFKVIDLFSLRYRAHDQCAYLVTRLDTPPPSRYPLSPPLPSCPCYRCTASLGNASRRSPIAVSLCQRTANARQSPCYSFNLHFSNATLIDIGQRTVDNGQRTTANGLQTGPDWIVRRFKYAACLPCASRVRNQKPA